MQSFLHPGQSLNRDFGSNGALPPVFWGLPVVVAGFVTSLFVRQSSLAAAVLIGLLALLYLYWLVCIFRIHQVLAEATGNLHPVKPGSAVALNILAGPVAAFVAAQVLSAATRMTVQVDDLVGEVMPNFLPIANSAVALLQQYGTYLAVAIACAAGVFWQMKTLNCLRLFVESRRAWTGRHLSALGAAIVGVSLVGPGCLWILGTGTPAPSWAQPSDSHQSVLMLAFVCCFLAFGTLSLINKQLSVALSSKQTAC